MMIKSMITYIKNYFLKYEEDWVQYWAHYGGPR